MATAPKEYKKGSQDISGQHETFALFWTLTKWSIIVIAVTLILLAYLFT
jgi:hypothetical protein